MSAPYPLGVGIDKHIGPVPTVQGIAHAEPAVAVATPVVQQSADVLYAEAPAPVYADREAKVSSIPQNQPDYSHIYELPSRDSCSCQAQRKIGGNYLDGTKEFRFPAQNLVLHSCACQSKIVIDARNAAFPPTNTAVIETSGCQQQILIYVPPETGTQGDIGGCQVQTQTKDKRKNKTSVRQANNIIVKNGKNCCACQSQVEFVRLNYGQKPPKCIVM